MCIVVLIDVKGCVCFYFSIWFSKDLKFKVVKRILRVFVEGVFLWECKFRYKLDSFFICGLGGFGEDGNFKMLFVFSCFFSNFYGLSV